MNVVRPMPTEANPAAISKAAGTRSQPHGDRIVPMASITITKATEYSAPRLRAQAISPIATSIGPSGVASTPSYTRPNFSLWNTLDVES